MIVNNVNFYTGHTFETEHNQGKIPDRAWSKLRTISDELCRKHGLSIIENPHLSKGKSHWGWELDQQNLSCKEQLKRTIDEVIKVSEDFEDFLQKCADCRAYLCLKATSGERKRPSEPSEPAERKTNRLKQQALRKGSESL